MLQGTHPLWFISMIGRGQMPTCFLHSHKPKHVQQAMKQPTDIRFSGRPCQSPACFILLLKYRPALQKSTLKFWLVVKPEEPSRRSMFQLYLASSFHSYFDATAWAKEITTVRDQEAEFYFGGWGGVVMLCHFWNVPWNNKKCMFLLISFSLPFSWNSTPCADVMDAFTRKKKCSV